MPKITVTFKECIQDSQEYGSNNEHMVSRVWTDISEDGIDRGSWIADLKQTVGSDFDTGDIEVTAPSKWQVRSRKRRTLVSSIRTASQKKRGRITGS